MMPRTALNPNPAAKRQARTLENFICRKISSHPCHRLSTGESSDAGGRGCIRGCGDRGERIRTGGQTLRGEVVGRRRNGTEQRRPIVKRNTRDCAVTGGCAQGDVGGRNESCAFGRTGECHSRWLW